MIIIITMIMMIIIIMIMIMTIIMITNTLILTTGHLPGPRALLRPDRTAALLGTVAVLSKQKLDIASSGENAAELSRTRRYVFVLTPPRGGPPKSRLRACTNNS